jgi:hypothetical protein
MAKRAPKTKRKRSTAKPRQGRKRADYGYEIVMIEPVNGSELPLTFEALGTSDAPVGSTIEAKLYDDQNAEQDSDTWNLDGEKGWRISLTAPAAGDYRIDVNFPAAAPPPLATAQVTIYRQSLSITSPASGSSIDDLISVTGTFVPGQAVDVTFTGGGATIPKPADTDNATGTWEVFFSGLPPCNDGRFEATSGGATAEVDGLTVSDAGIITSPVNDEVIIGRLTTGRRATARPFKGTINISNCDVWIAATVRGKHNHPPTKRPVNALGEWTIPIESVFRGRPRTGFYYFHLVAQTRTAPIRRFLLGSGRFEVR